MSWIEGYACGRRRGGGNILEKTFIKNGEYIAREDEEAPCDGWSPVVVNLPLDTITVNENHKTYKASDYELEGFSEVTTNILIDELNVSENGTYTAESPVAGYSPVTVNVPSWADAKRFYIDQGGTGTAGTGDQNYGKELTKQMGLDYTVAAGTIIDSGNDTNDWYIHAERFAHSWVFRIKNDTTSVNKLLIEINDGMRPRASNISWKVAEDESLSGTQYRLFVEYDYYLNGEWQHTTQASSYSGASGQQNSRYCQQYLGGSESTFTVNVT